MLEALRIDASPRPLGGATGASWAVGHHVLRIGPRRRMERELAAAYAAASHVRVPHVVDRVDQQAHTGILTDMIAGGTVAALERCTVDVARRRGEQCGRLHHQLAHALAPTLVPTVTGDHLAAEHSPHRLLHLDLHPENILIDRTGELVIIDWANAAAGPPVLDIARTATILTHDPRARSRSDDPLWRALIEGWATTADWVQLPVAAQLWALDFMLADLTDRRPSDQLDPIRRVRAGLTST